MSRLSKSSRGCFPLSSSRLDPRPGPQDKEEDAGGSKELGRIGGRGGGGAHHPGAEDNGSKEGKQEGRAALQGPPRKQEGGLERRLCLPPGKGERLGAGNEDSARGWEVQEQSYACGHGGIYR